MAEYNPKFKYCPRLNRTSGNQRIHKVYVMQLIKNKDVRTVSEINAEIKYLLEGKYRFVSVSGGDIKPEDPLLRAPVFHLKGQ